MFLTVFQDIEISVMAILNDSTGTLMSCAWLNPYCRIGVIAGEFNRTGRDFGVFFFCTGYLLLTNLFACFFYLYLVEAQKNVFNGMLEDIISFLIVIC